MKTAIDGHHSIQVIATVRGVFVGTAKVENLYTNPWLSCLYVRPEHARGGIATKLVQEAVQLTKAAGAHALGLTVSDENHAAIACYEALEFRRFRDNEQMKGFSD